MDNMPTPNRELVKEYGFFDYFKSSIEAGEDPLNLARYLAEQRQAKQRKLFGE